jgi:hypothetical protein
MGKHHKSPASDKSAAAMLHAPLMIASAIEKESHPFIDLLDQMRSLGIEKDMPIPQIAAMGDQSSGKSYVLEAISNLPFPRGSGLVTKCAKELRMKKTHAGKPVAGVHPDLMGTSAAGRRWPGDVARRYRQQDREADGLPPGGAGRRGVIRVRALHHD